MKARIMCTAVQIQYSAAYKVKFLWQFIINKYTTWRQKIHTTQNTIHCGTMGVGVSREKRPNEQKFKKGGGNLVFVLLCFNYSTVSVYVSNIT